MSTANREPGPAPAKTPLPRRRRWGLRTLGCLGLAIFAIAVAGSQGYHTVGTFGCVGLGLVGAAFCSLRGIQDLVDLEWYRMRLVRRKPEQLPLPDDDWRVGS